VIVGPSIETIINLVVTSLEAQDVADDGRLAKGLGLSWAFLPIKLF
jgi:hypothetical protein